MQRIYDRYREDGYSMIAINILPDQDGLVEKWKTEHGYTFPILIGANTETIIERYGLRATPLNILIDPHRNILYRSEGYKMGAEEKIEEEVRRALGLAPE